MVQAGSSDAGEHWPPLGRGRLHRAADRWTARRCSTGRQGTGRSQRPPPEDILILPGIFPVVGRTEAEARERFEELQILIHPAVGLSILEHCLGIPLSHLPFDGPLPDESRSPTPPSAARELLIDLAHREACRSANWRSASPVRAATGRSSGRRRTSSTGWKSSS